MVLVGFNWMPRERLCWWWQWCTMRTASITVRLNGHRQGWRKERVKVVCLFVWCKSTQKSDDQSSRQTLHDFSDHWASTQQAPIGHCSMLSTTSGHCHHLQNQLSVSLFECTDVYCLLFCMFCSLCYIDHWPFFNWLSCCCQLFFPPSLNHFL